MNMSLSKEQLTRYRRTILIPEIGQAGQEKLLSSRALIVGAGGLGSASSFYLAASGLGTIGIVDFDRVELDNLQRQILHGTSDLGRPKVDSAKDTLKGINPDLEIVTYPDKLSQDNVCDTIKNYDVILECSDNFTTKYLVNDTCFFLKKTLVYASAIKLEGHLMSIVPASSACYRCVFPLEPPPGVSASTQEVGILGTVPGVIGLIQAQEAIKYLLGIGQLMTDTLFMYDALRAEFRKVVIRRNPSCPLCGANPTITGIK